MKAVVDIYIVKTKAVVEDTFETDGNNGSSLILHRDVRYAQTENAKNYAEVVSPPARLQKRELFYDRYKGPVHTSQYPSDIEEGDKIYFNYNSLLDMDYLKVDNGWQYYHVYADAVQCYVREGEVFPSFGTLLIEPYYGEDLEDIELDIDDKKSMIKGKVSASGLITSLVNDPEYLHGIVSKVGDFRFLPDDSFAEGDHVLFVKNSDWTNKIEGKEYYIMKEWDVMAKIVDDEICCLGGFVAIKPDPANKLNDAGIHFLKDQSADVYYGDVVSYGSEVGGLVEGDRVCFKKKTRNLNRMKGDGVWFVKEEDLLFVISE